MMCICISYWSLYSFLGCVYYLTLVGKLHTHICVNYKVIPSGLAFVQIFHIVIRHYYSLLHENRAKIGWLLVLAMALSNSVSNVCVVNIVFTSMCV